MCLCTSLYSIIGNDDLLPISDVDKYYYYEYDGILIQHVVWYVSEETIKGESVPLFIDLAGGGGRPAFL